MVTALECGQLCSLPGQDMKAGICCGENLIGVQVLSFEGALRGQRRPAFKLGNLPSMKSNWRCAFTAGQTKAPCLSILNRAGRKTLSRAAIK